MHTSKAAFRFHALAFDHRGDRSIPNITVELTDITEWSLATYLTIRKIEGPSILEAAILTLELQ